MSKSKSNLNKEFSKISLQIPAGKANPAPPVGPALGQKGLNIMEFCKSFNDKTKGEEPGKPLRVEIKAYKDRTFDYVIKGAPVSYLLKKAANIQKGCSTAGRSFIGTISEEKIREVAEEKMKLGLSARDLDAACKIVAGSARSMGLKVLGGNNA